jgi:hypothetical protein
MKEEGERDRREERISTNAKFFLKKNFFNNNYFVIMKLTN